MDTLSSTDPVIPVAGWALAYVGAGWNGTEGMVRIAGKEEMERRGVSDMTCLPGQQLTPHLLASRSVPIA